MKMDMHEAKDCIYRRPTSVVAFSGALFFS